MLSGFRKRSRNLYDISLRKCMQFVVLTARDQFMGVTEENPKTRSQDCKSTTAISQHSLSTHTICSASLFTPSHPSSRLTKSLLFVAESVQDFGIFDDPSRRSTIVDETLTEFIHVLIVAMREKGENADRQTLWDLRFLRAICEDRELSELALVLDELSTDLQKVLSVLVSYSLTLIISYRTMRTIPKPTSKAVSSALSLK